jgi:uncharacterized membrane protein SpoIIM required for sporulation
LIFASGMVMMFAHWQTFQKEIDSTTKKNDRQHYQRKFRRRTLIGSMISIVGALLATYFITENPRTQFLVIIATLLMLLVLMIFSLVDMFSVYIYVQHSPEAGEARKKLAREYKKIRDEIAAANNNSENDPIVNDVVDSGHNDNAAENNGGQEQRPK